MIAQGLAGATGKIVMWAHIDAKAGTPGALDNRTGVATLLLLADAAATSKAASTSRS